MRKSDSLITRVLKKKGKNIYIPVLYKIKMLLKYLENWDIWARKSVRMEGTVEKPGRWDIPLLKWLCDEWTRLTSSRHPSGEKEGKR